MKKRLRIGYLFVLIPILVISIFMLTACSDNEVPDVPTGLTAVYGQTLGDVELPDKWTWNDSLSTSVGDVGTQFFYATYKGSNAQVVLLFITVTKAVPADVGGFAVTSVGGSHTIAIDSEGHVWTWGTNRYGQLGHGGVADESSPRMLEGVDGLTNIIAVAAGSSTSFAVDGEGNIWAWGYGHSGHLGHGSEADENRPRMIEGVNGFADIISIAAGENYVLALDKQGCIWTWGAGHTGGLGHGGSTNKYRPHKLVTGANGETLPMFTAVSGGGGVSMALDISGNLWTWGGSNYGQLGNGSPASWSQVFRPSMLIKGYSDTDLPKFTAISAGRDNSIALDEDGRIWTWGYGLEGELGHGILANELRPRMVEALTDIVKMSAGTNVYPSTGRIVLDAQGNSWLTSSSGNWVKE